MNIPWSYWLGKYEVTAQQYCDFLNAAYIAGRIRRSGTTAVYSITGTNLINRIDGVYLLCDIGDSYKIRWNVNNFEVVGVYTNYPVDVTWYGAMAFANFYGYDLPTEAEWEKAARGPDFDDQDEHCLYTWGNDKSDSKANFLYYNYSGHGGEKSVGFYDGNQTPIGPNMVNGYGLYDMTGNVREWTRTLGYYNTTGGSSGDVTQTLETYPQLELLDADRHSYWIHLSHYPRFVIKDGMPIYYRDSPNNSTRGGFRVCRRHGVADGTTGE